MKVRFSRQADIDVAGIRAFIRQDSPARAATFARELVAESVSIGTMPLGFPALSSDSPSGFRRKVYKGYLIVYRIGGGTVEIVRVLHGARNIERLLTSGEP